MPTPSPLKDIEAVRSLLAKISFLGGFNEADLDSVLDYFENVSFQAGDCIVRKGEEPTHIYIIQRGRVELHITDGNKEVRKREFEVGDHFGEVALLSLVNDSATFVALEDCEFIAFPRKALHRLKREIPDFFCRIVLNIARDLARKVQYSDDLMLRS